MVPAKLCMHATIYVLMREYLCWLCMVVNGGLACQWGNLHLHSFDCHAQFRQKAANTAVYVARKSFDTATSYKLEDMNERKWLRRFLFLETIAGEAAP